MLWVTGEYRGKEGARYLSRKLISAAHPNPLWSTRWIHSEEAFLPGILSSGHDGFLYREKHGCWEEERRFTDRLQWKGNAYNGGGGECTNPNYRGGGECINPNCRWSLPRRSKQLWRLVSIAGRKARKLRNRLASAMRIDMETWLGLTLRSSGRVCEIPSQVAHVQLLRTPTKFLGLLRGMETKNTGSQCSFVLEVQFWSCSFMWEVA